MKVDGRYHGYLSVSLFCFPFLVPFCSLASDLLLEYLASFLLPCIEDGQVPHASSPPPLLPLTLPL